MCDMHVRGAAKRCPRESRFYVRLRTGPQTLADGSVETTPAGRSVTVCAGHLARAVRTLEALDIRWHGAQVTVSQL